MVSIRFRKFNVAILGCFELNISGEVASLSIVLWLAGFKCKGYNKFLPHLCLFFLSFPKKENFTG